MPRHPNPPWIEFPDIPWGSVGWRMGFGERHWLTWVEWWSKSTSTGERDAYQSRWPEPEEWAGFYEFISTGETPPWVLEERRKTEAAAQPPQAGEHTITERYRVKWLATRYFRKPKVPVRDPLETEPYRMLIDPEGWLWNLHLPESSRNEFKAPYFTRQVTEVIGRDNLPVEQPVA